MLATLLNIAKWVGIVVGALIAILVLALVPELLVIECRDPRPFRFVHGEGSLVSVGPSSTLSVHRHTVLLHGLCGLLIRS